MPQNATKLVIKTLAITFVMYHVPPFYSYSERLYVAIMQSVIMQSVIMLCFITKIIIMCHYAASYHAECC
jgi:hypothetical protein